MKELVTMKNESNFKEHKKNTSFYLIIVYFLIGAIFSILTVMTYIFYGGISGIKSAGLLIEQIGILLFFAFLGITGLYFAFKNIRSATLTQKRYFGVIALIFIVSCFIYGVKQRYFDVSDKVIDSSGNVKVILVEDTLSKEGLEFIVINSLPQKVYYTGSYSLEIKRFGRWFEVPSSMKRYNGPVTVLGWSMPITTQENIQINWERHYGKIRNGRYRIVLKVYQDKNYSNEKTALYIADEFLID